MIYSQLRENEKTARAEVKVTPGNRCQLNMNGQSATSAEAKTKSRKAEIPQSWMIGDRAEGYWVDLESEFVRMATRATMDLGFGSGEEGKAGSELTYRLQRTADSIYRDGVEDYLTMLGLLNLCEYFRLNTQLKRIDSEVENANQVGIVGEGYFACRKLAIELDLAEVTEWLVAHGIGLPDLRLFYPGEYKDESDGNAKKRGKKKEGEEEGEMPIALRYVAELIRLHQASVADLAGFVDDIRQRSMPEHDGEEGNEQPLSQEENAELTRAAIAKIKEVIPWLDVDQFERVYESVKFEERRRTERQQAALRRQQEMFEKRNRRGGRRDDRRGGGRERDQFQGQGGDGGEQGNDGDQPPGLALDSIQTRSREDSGNELFGDMEEHGDNSNAEERGNFEGEFNESQPDDSRPRQAAGPRPPQHQQPRGEQRGGDPRGGGGQPGRNNNWKQRKDAHPLPAGRRKQRQRGRGGLDFDEVQPMSNDTPGLKPTGVGHGAPHRPAGGGPKGPKRPWRGHR